LKEVRDNRGLKMTPQRMAIMNYLKGNSSHPSALEVYKAVSEQFPTMSLTTVYKTLQTLSSNRMVIELSIDPEKKRFDPNLESHRHMTCVRCRKIIDIKGDFSLQLSESEKQGFEIIESRIEFCGLCPACKSGTKSRRQKGNSAWATPRQATGIKGEKI
jgi:Fur family transcriptional regulator, peroxide stress response regulator